MGCFLFLPGRARGPNARRPTPTHTIYYSALVGGGRRPFGPHLAAMACVIKVDSYAEGLATVNDTRFGLTAGIMTRDLARATHFRRNARTGCVMVNLATAGTDYHVPFGGRGESSYGPREQGQYAKDFYTVVKTAYIKANEPI